MEYISKVVGKIIDNDIEGLLISLNEIINEGKDLDNFLWEVIKYIKNILVYKAIGNLEIYNKEEIAVISNLSKKVTKGRLLELIYTLSELANTIKWSSQKVIILQSGFIKVCLNENEVEPPQNIDNRNQEIEDRSNKIEKKITENVKKEEDKKPCDDKYLKYWPKILDLLKSSGKVMLYTNLIGTKAKKANDLQIEIEFAGKITPFAKSVLEQNENKDAIIKMISTEEGMHMQIKYVEGAHEETIKTDNSKINNNDIGIPINIIDE